MKGSDNVAEKFYEYFIPIQKLISNLPEKSRDMLLWYSLNRKCEKQLVVDILKKIEKCDSPIEVIFLTAFMILKEEYFHSYNFCIHLQHKVYANENTYRVDFLILCSDKKQVCNEVKCVVECDGHDFHKLTKKQVVKDNERDFALKKIGFDIIHFSGTQLYINAWKCAFEVLQYMVDKLNREVTKFGDIQNRINDILD